MKFTHEEMMVIIQGLRLVNGMDQRDRSYTPTVEDQITATSLLIRFDEDAEG